MHLFDQNDHLNKYETIEEIINNYYDLRLEYYTKRKNSMLIELENDLNTISNKARFISMNINDEIDLRKKKNDEINEIMSTLKFDKDKNKDNYNYLVKMPMDSVSEENVEKLMKEKEEKQEKLDKLKSKTILNIWIEELEILKLEYNKFLEDSNDDKCSESTKTTKITKTSKKTKAQS